MARAQSILLVNVGGKTLPVHAVDGLIPEVMSHGRLQRAARPSGISLLPAAAYHDGFVQFEQFEIMDRYFENNGNQFSHDFFIRGALISNQPLRNCYMVLVVLPHLEEAASIITLEMPDLDPGQRTGFKLEIPLSGGLTDRVFHVRFFSGTSECVHSKMSSGQVMAASERKDSAILEKTESRGLSPIFTVFPARPEGLPPDLAGKASIRCRIGLDGEVAEATVAEATRPEFGESALAAAQQWIFAPAIKNHRYVPVAVKIPFLFSPVTAKQG